MLIPDQIYPKLRDTLLLCEVFASYSALESLFVTQSLNVWRYSLPKAESSMNLVRQTIRFLSERYDVQRRNALILLLQTLRNEYSPQDSLYVKLDTLMDDLLEATYQTISQPELSIDSDVAKRKGLIVAVSGGYAPLPAESAIHYHMGDEGLTHCWLIQGPGDDKPTSSPSNTHRIRDELRSRGVVVDIFPLDDVDDIDQVFEMIPNIVGQAKSKYKLDPQEIIADYTGGTKSLTAGMILGAMATNIDLQYMKPNAYESNGRMKKDAGSSPRQVQISFVDVRPTGNNLP